MSAESGSKSRGAINNRSAASSSWVVAVTRIWRLGSIYFKGEQKLRAYFLLSSVLFLCAMTAGIHVALSYVQRDFSTALSKKDVAGFELAVWKFIGIIIVATPLIALYHYMQNLLGVEWRVWLTDFLLSDYFANRAYFALKMEGKLDNPDQRICEDVASFVGNAVDIISLTSSKVLHSFAFAGVLWSIAPELVYFLLLYSVVGTFVTIHIFGKKIMQLKLQSLQKEADFRYSLVRIRDNAESIAFYRAEKHELHSIKGFFSALVKNAREFIIWSRHLALFSNAYDFVVLIVPSLIIAPRFFKGEVEFGVVTQSAYAFRNRYFTALGNMGSSSRILIIGGTGYIGRHISKASLALGHPTFLLVRETTTYNPEKAKLLESFKSSGAIILHGSLEDKVSLVEAIKKVDVVISAVKGPQLMDQLNIIKVIKEVGTIKRFLPSEFGNDVDRTHAVDPAKTMFASKAKIRRAIEAEGIPYTYVASNCFAGFFLPSLGQPGLTAPPRDKIVIAGDGNARAVFVKEEDIGTFTIKAVDDPRTLNKILYLRLPANTYSINELVALWEKKIGKTLEKTYITEEEVLKKIAGSSFPVTILLSTGHSIFVKGDQTNFEIGPDGVEASQLYPEVKYTTVEEYLSQYI